MRGGACHGMSYHIEIGEQPSNAFEGYPKSSTGRHNVPTSDPMVPFTPPFLCMNYAPPPLNCKP